MRQTFGPERLSLFYWSNRAITLDRERAWFIVFSLITPPTPAAVTVFASHAKRNTSVRAGEDRAGGFPPGLSVRSSLMHPPPARPCDRTRCACGAA